MCQGSLHFTHPLYKSICLCWVCVWVCARERKCECVGGLCRSLFCPSFCLFLFTLSSSKSLEPLKADRHCSSLQGKTDKTCPKFESSFPIKRKKVCFALIPFKEAAALRWDVPVKWLSTSFSSIRLFYQDISQRFPRGHLLIKLWPGLYRSFTWTLFKFIFSF